MNFQKIIACSSRIAKWTRTFCRSLRRRYNQKRKTSVLRKEKDTRVDFSMRRSPISAERGPLFFFGGLPAHNKVGGVASFTYAFAETFGASRLIVVDMYPARGKEIPPGTKVVFVGGHRAVRAAKIFYFMATNEGCYILNFSSIRVLAVLALLPKTKKSKWLTIFHNGDLQQVFDKRGLLFQYAVRRGIGRVDIPCYLSDRQRVFFSSICSKELYRVSPFVNASCDKNICRQKPTTHNSTVCNILVSGYPTRIYRIEETVSILEKLWDRGFDFNLDVCLYGRDDDGIMNNIVSKVSSLPRANLHVHLNSRDFRAVLLKTDIYLRLNAVDSFGLVVAEALERGAVVIATDVCERYHGTNLVGRDDFDLVFKELAYYLQHGKLSGGLRVQQRLDGIYKHDTLIKMLCALR